MSKFSEFMNKPRSDGEIIMGCLVLLMLLLPVVVFLLSLVMADIQGTACFNDKCYTFGQTTQG